MERVFERSRADFISKVMANMGMGLFITFLTAYYTYSSEWLLSFIFGSPFVFLVLMAGEIGLVVYLSRRLEKMSFAQARTGFFAYAVLNGLTLSVIFLTYTMSSIYYVFLIAAIMFIFAGFIGMTVKKDLSAMGHFLILSVIGLIAVSILNIFLRIPAMDNLISFAGVIIFSGLTAYDMQKIKAMHYNAYNMEGERAAKYSIIGALELYLDFINLFLYLLRLFGRKK
jgi:FtsH-binding integral membrane protein